MRHTLIFLAAAATVAAQSNNASISGVVSDPQGAAMPGVEVVATHVDTGVRTTAPTNAAGFYSLRNLPIGAYALSAEMQGFRKYQRTGILLTTGQSAEIAIVLEIGSLAESVTVEASAPLLETRTSDASQLVESKTIEDMPLGDRRAMNLIEITGAAVFVDYDNGSKPNFSLAGGRTQSQMFWIDGATGQNMRLGVGQMDIDPPVESLQEVKVMGNGFSAEFGGSAGGVVIANTKSGTNQIKGSLFEYLRNQKLDAPAYFAPVVNGGKSKPALRYNVFGGTVGGPIRRDRTFFFFSYEGSRRRDGSIRTFNVPSLLERKGDFSQTYNQRGVRLPMYDPATSRVEEGSTRVVRDPFPGNVIPTARFDPVAARLIEFYPLPVRPGDDPSGANNFRANDVVALTRNNFVVKMDHRLGQRHTFYGRYMYNSDIRANRSVYPVRAADTVNDNDHHQQYWHGVWTFIAKPNLILESRFTYGNRQAHTFSPGLGSGYIEKLGIRGVPDVAFPRIAAAGYVALGSSNMDRQQYPIEQYQVVGNVSWVRGKHTYKFGGELRPSYNYEVNRALVSGQFTFNRPLSGLPQNTNSGNGIATLLLGFPSRFEARETPVLDRSSWYAAWFLQDDWNVLPGLTLNVGLRWEADTPMIDANARMNGFDPDAINPVSGTRGVVKFAGVNGWPVRQYDPDWNNYGPRVGFAWQPFGMKKTVIRGGYGVFFAHPFDRGNPTAAALGFEKSVTLITQDNGQSLPYSLQSGMPAAAVAQKLDDTFGAVAAGTLPNQSISYFQPRRRTGYSQQFNLRVQRELPGQILVEAGYLGNISRKLPSSNLSINQIPTWLLGPGVGRSQTIFPQFSDVTWISPTIGYSNYNASMVKVEKRFSRGLNILSTYTWSKFLDDTDAGGGATFGDEGSTYSDFYNRRADYGPSENDIRHRLTWSSVYQLPFGKGRRYLKRNPARYLAGGWSIGSIMTTQTGAPFTVHTQTNNTRAFSAGAQRADVIRDPNLPASQRSLNRWFDTEAFQQPAEYTFGNQGINLLRADGTFKINTSLIRTFRFERKQLQFRGEFFNVLNHPDFGIPGRTFEGPGFGVINNARPMRQVQIGLRLTY